METAVLDANVVFRNGLRDFLLSAAFAGAYSPAWSDAIHGEWMHNRAEVYRDSQSVLDYARNQMEEAFPGSNVPLDPDVLRDVLSLCASDAERKDAHVVTTAVVAEASTIVTFNGRDFPERILFRYCLRAEKPDEFCERIFPARIAQFEAGSRMQRARLTKPARSRDDYLRHLRDALGMCPGRLTSSRLTGTRSDRLFRVRSLS
jgi:hypothetical protein